MAERKTVIHELFDAGVILKGIDGVLEVLGGFLAFAIPPAALDRLVITLTQHELSQDPHDFFANHILQALQRMGHSTQVFAAVYLLAHGVVKIVLAIGLFKEQRWAMPASISFLALFILYQIYRIGLTHSISLVLLTIFDAAIIWLIWLEYRRPRQSTR